jgi:hypothetical protein
MLNAVTKAADPPFDAIFSGDLIDHRFTHWNTYHNLLGSRNGLGRMDGAQAWT